MDTTCRLRVVAWMYALVGAYALIEQVVSLFRPLDNPIAFVYLGLPGVNLAILLLPIGVGLMVRKKSCPEAGSRWELGPRWPLRFDSGRLCPKRARRRRVSMGSCGGSRGRGCHRARRRCPRHWGATLRLAAVPIALQGDSRANGVQWRSGRLVER